VAEWSNAAVLKTAEPGPPAPWVRIPPPPLNRQIPLYRRDCDHIADRDRDSAVGQRRPAQTASAGSSFPRRSPEPLVEHASAGPVLPSYPAHQRSRRGSVKGSPTGPSAASREAVPLTGSRGGASRTRRLSRRIARRAANRTTHRASKIRTRSQTPRFSVVPGFPGRRGEPPRWPLLGGIVAASSARRGWGRTALGTSRGRLLWHRARGYRPPGCDASAGAAGHVGVAMSSPCVCGTHVADLGPQIRRSRPDQPISGAGWWRQEEPDRAERSELRSSPLDGDGRWS
jgi:hypothetical protein